MNSRPAFYSIVRQSILTILLFSLSACGTVTVVPTPTPALPQATIAPDPSPIPTIAQPTIPPPTIAAATRLAEAIAQTQALERYRMGFIVGATDPNSDSSDATETVIAQNGLFRSADFAVTRNAGPGQRDGGQEIVRVDDSIYARGSLPFPNTNPYAWYTFGSAPPVELAPPFTLPFLLSSLTGRIDLNELQFTETITLNGQECERFTGGLPVAVGMLDGLGTPTTAEAQTAEATPVVERMEAQGFRFGDATASMDVCADGYLYAVRSVVTISRMDTPESAIRSNLEVTLSDLNTDIAIEFPPDPISFDPDGVLPPRAFAIQGGTVHREPDASSEVVAELGPTSIVIVLAQSAESLWYQVQTLEGVQGWILSESISSPPDETFTIPFAP